MLSVQEEVGEQRATVHVLHAGLMDKEDEDDEEEGKLYTGGGRKREKESLRVSPCRFSPLPSMKTPSAYI